MVGEHGCAIAVDTVAARLSRVGGIVERINYTGMKKTLRVFLFFAVLLSWGALSRVQGAPFSGGDGTKASPYEIATLDDLKFLSEHMEYWRSSLCFKQTADIDASDTKTWNPKDGVPQGFKPIGVKNWGFIGVYDGDNHVISGLYISRESESDETIGLFGHLFVDAPIWHLQNIRLVGASVSGKKCVGSLVGRVTGNGGIRNCHVEVDAVVGDEQVGGLIGSIGGTFNVSGCSAVPARFGAYVKGKRMVGGLIGDHTGGVYPPKLELSYSTVNVVAKCEANTMGGFAGRLMNCHVENCFSVGGMRGLHGGFDAVAGFVGSANNTGVTGCYAAVAIEADEGNYVGKGFCHSATAGTSLKNCYYQSSFNGAVVSDGTAGVAGLGESELKGGTLPGGFDAGAWRAEKGGYPVLQGAPKATITYGVECEGGEIEIEDGLRSGAQLSYGLTLRINAKPSVGYSMQKVTLNGAELPLENGSAQWIAVRGDNAISVCFGKDKFNVSGRVAEGEGKISIGEIPTGEGEAEFGSELNITLEPSEGYEVAALECGGTVIPVDAGKATWRVAAGENLIVAKLRKKTLVFYATEGGYGYLTVEGVQNGGEVKVGQKLAIVLKAETHYEVAELTCNGTPLTVENGRATWVVQDGWNKIVARFKSDGTSQDDTTPVESELLGDVHAAPNPTEGVVWLHGAERVLRCAVYSVMGRLMQSYTLRGEGEAAIDLTQYPSGMYLLRLEDANGGVRTLRVMRR